MESIAALDTSCVIFANIALINAALAWVHIQIIELLYQANTLTLFRCRVVCRSLWALKAKRIRVAANTIFNKAATSKNSVVFPIIDDYHLFNWAIIQSKIFQAIFHYKWIISILIHSVRRIWRADSTGSFISCCLIKKNNFWFSEKIILKRENHMFNIHLIFILNF